MNTIELTEPALFRHHLARLEAEVSILPDHPEETPDSTLRALWAMAAGTPLSVVAAADREPEPLTPEGERLLAALVERRVTGSPLAHLTGRQSFMGVELLAGPEALVPRIETEILGRTALDLVHATDASLVIDLCTGAGNLAAGVAVAEPQLTIHAADLSVAAVGLARANMLFIDAADRVTLYDGDLFDALPEELHGQADVVICNPPYISSAKVGEMAPEISEHEPRLAFDGGSLGLSIVGRLVQEAPTWLRPGGRLCFEIGLGQGPYWHKRVLRFPGWAEVGSVEDDEGNVRVITAVRE
ncbi:release factor glutamine methyltransferase [Nocardioides sp. BE266]|uniref:N5-glutamine methyltransferase family protein n=1 Tax=Nocardioides sp. BE266 TaxID=2817725 RepID=UPI002860439F|nr:HemK family protein methyltransferase [Nocardioides sp. BE266]MDR7253094.1 release factor glutamine methyltransferase [Nocardioides sp. BE266]